jgi:sterol desaturase/sphingolipid hydroxylase (fatty acid hydroxylase superfamily)
MDEYIEIFVTSFLDYGGYLASEVVTFHWKNFFYWLIGISMAFMVLEIVIPWRKSQKVFRQDFWLDTFYMFFNFFLFSLVGYYAISNVFVKAFNDFLMHVFGVKNIIAIHIEQWPEIAQLLLLFVLRDFIHWNVHRLLHRVPFLWEFHKVHHSVKEMGFASHLRFHWMETVVYRTIEYIPLGMIGFGIQEFFLVHLIAIIIGHYNHSNIRIPLGPLKYVINNPQMHTFHHARILPEKHRYGVNFGISLSLWDYLFRTSYTEKSGEDVLLGFEGDDEFPRSFKGQVFYGLNRKNNNGKI